MDCNTARQLLVFHRPHANELEAGEVEALQTHLGECPVCASQTEAEHRIDQHLSRAMRQVEVPDGLRDRILGQLAAERGDWQRKRLGTVARFGAIAAALALLLWGWWAWDTRTRPTVDPEKVFTQFHHDRPGNAQDVNEAFQRMGVKTQAPLNLHYALLSHLGLSELPDYPGKMVPRLDFRTPTERGEERAVIFILSHRQFNLASLAENPGVDLGYPYKLQVKFKPGDAFAYLVFYTGPNADWLLDN
jgi:hypothetical protein